MNRILSKFNILLAITTLSACTISGGEMRRSVGLGKDAPDEFMVLTRRKLEIPDNMYLPQPGEQTSASAREASVEAREEIFGVKTKQAKENSELENSLTARLARFKSDENIRKTINKEAKADYGDSTLNSITDPFGYNRGDAEVINGEKENKRIKKLLAKGKMISGEEASTTTKYKKLQ